jgi:hypothetical protein
VNSQRQKNQTDFQHWQQRTERVVAIDRRLKFFRPQTKRVDGQMQHQKSAQHKTGERKIMARTSAATAITLILGLLAKFKGEDDARIRWRRRASVGTVAAAAAGTVSTVGFG